jgi:signal transduction histidine kinase
MMRGYFLEGSMANILVVDDDVHALRAMRELLEGPGRNVIVAGSGAEALRQILRTDFALILMDVRMPRMDGFETAALLRSRKRSRHTPLIFLTGAVDDAESRARGYEVGAVDYIVKPVDAEVLKAKVAVFVDLNSQSTDLATRIVQHKDTEREYARALDDLEFKVRERTATLIAANERLRKEIERRELADTELNKAKQAADAANLAKSSFLANMSHEIRTPMNAIVGLTELALQTPLTTEQREYLEMTRASADSLLSIVSGILDFSKIEAGRLEVECNPFRLRECVGEVVKTLAFEARKKGLEFSCEIAPDVPEALLGDAIKLRQVLINLVGNAIKFAEQGEVALSIQSEAIDAAGTTCQVTVRDTGIGISKDKQAAVFAPFTQGDATTTRRYGGTGLGLAISARLVEMMGGRIWLESEPGKGSTFHFTARFARPEQALPASARAESRARPAAATLRSPLAILLVEDNPLNRRLTLAVLEKEGHRVTVAGNGVAGLEAFRCGKFDVVLMDVQMPLMDGIEATLAIRAHERISGGRVPIVAFTAHATVADRDRCMGAGMDGYLTKPIRPTELLEAIERQFVAPPGRAAPAKRIVLDRAALLDQVDGDRQLLSEITELFLSEYSGLMTRAREAMARRDRSDFSTAVHTLRGMLRSLSADAAQRVAGTLQGLDLKRSDMGEVAANFELLEQEVTSLKTELQQFAFEAPGAPGLVHGPIELS